MQPKLTRLDISIESRLKNGLIVLSGGKRGALTNLGREILSEAVENYEQGFYCEPPVRDSSSQIYILRVSPELKASLHKIAASEARKLKVVVERMLREGVEKLFEQLSSETN